MLKNEKFYSVTGRVSLFGDVSFADTIRRILASFSRMVTTKPNPLSVAGNGKGADIFCNAFILVLTI